MTAETLTLVALFSLLGQAALVTLAPVAVRVAARR
jgi:hypothetical protein